MRTILRQLEDSSPTLRRLRWRKRMRCLRRLVVVAVFAFLGWGVANWRAQSGDVEHYAVEAQGPRGAAYSMLDLRIMPVFRARRA